MSTVKKSPHLIRNSGNANLITPVIEGDIRLADAIMRNERLLLVIERFGISLGFGDKTINEVAETYRLDPSLVLALKANYSENIFIGLPLPSTGGLL